MYMGTYCPVHIKLQFGVAAALCNQINYYVVQSLTSVLTLSSHEIPPPLPPILHHVPRAHNTVHYTDTTPHTRHNEYHFFTMEC